MSTTLAETGTQTVTRTTANTKRPAQVSPSLLTDRYELTMLSSFIGDGTVGKRAVFEAFGRKLPKGRRYGVVAGLGRLISMIEQFTFRDDEIAFLLTNGVINEATAEYLTDFRFTGTIDAYREGEVYFANSPVLTVEGTLGECVILETLILSVLNHDSGIASTAARMVHAAAGRPIIEMGSRRTHEQAAVAASRAAYIAGFASTSNLAAGYLYGIPTVGTAAHAFTLAHAGMNQFGDASGEMAAFRSQVKTHTSSTSLLVDTYDIAQGIRNAVAAARQEEPGVNGPGAIRIDSGDLFEEARKARILLDDLGATETRITVTSDLDEYVMSDLANAPIDGYGVGTRLVTARPVGMVYKLVAIESTETHYDSTGEPTEWTVMRAVAKKASGKASVGGRKTAYRLLDADGTMTAETFTVTGHAPTQNARPLQVRVFDQGRVVHDPSLADIRAHHATAMAELPTSALDVSDGIALLVAALSDTQTPTSLPINQEGTATVTLIENTKANPDSHSTNTKRALLVVDVQNDFVEGGSLGVSGGKAVAARISDYAARNRDLYTVIIASKDSHNGEGTNDGHFHEPGTEPDFVNTWPVHCVAGTNGSEYAPEFDASVVDVHIRKGMGVAAYSMFEGFDSDNNWPLSEILSSYGITDVDVVGIATDHCVKATALDARSDGLNVRLLPGLHAGVAPETSQAAVEAMHAAGVTTD